MTNNTTKPVRKNYAWRRDTYEALLRVQRHLGVSSETAALEVLIHQFDRDSAPAVATASFDADDIMPLLTDHILEQWILCPSSYRIALYCDERGDLSVSYGLSVGDEIAEEERAITWVKCLGDTSSHWTSSDYWTADYGYWREDYLAEGFEEDPDGEPVLDDAVRYGIRFGEVEDIREDLAQRLAQRLAESLNDE